MMINKVLNFLKDYRHALLWTMAYTTFVYFVLFFCFNFNFLSIFDWAKVSHSRLRGFPGFAFMILILSAVPLYIATTTIIVRTKKPLFLIGKKIAAKKAEEKKPEPEIEPDVVFSPDMPNELRGAFLRARKLVILRQKSGFDMSGILAESDITKPEIIPIKNYVGTAPADETNFSLPDNFDFIKPPSNNAPTDFEIPLPDNFDISDTKKSDTPVFKTINFGENKIKNDEIATAKKDAEKNSTAPNFESPKLENYLKKRGIKTEIIDDILCADNKAIITHSDSDFWIADDAVWFANGKQKNSLIVRILEFVKSDVAKDFMSKNSNDMNGESEKSDFVNNLSDGNTVQSGCLQPVLYLPDANIMDLDEKIKNWESLGVKIIKKLTDF